MANVANEALINAYKDCLLNTCVRYAREHIPDLTLSNCLASSDFKENARVWLCLPFFTDTVKLNWHLGTAYNRLCVEMKK